VILQKISILPLPPQKEFEFPAGGSRGSERQKQKKEKRNV